LFAIYTYLGRRARPERWSDASHSHYFRRAKDNIRLMAGESRSARNWRPQILAFSADPARRERLMRFAAWLEGTSGLSAVAQSVQGSGAVKRRERAEAERVLQVQAESQGVDVSLVVLAPDVAEALPIIVQSFGVGPLRANTVLFGWPEHPDESRRSDYVATLREVMRFGLNVVSMSSDQTRWSVMQATDGRARRIDVWWEDSDEGHLALLLAYLFTRTDDWRRARLRVCVLIEDPSTAEQTEESLRLMLESVRIPAEVKAISGRPDLVTHLGGATLVAVPAHLRKERIIDPGGDDLFQLFEQLPLALP
jgi:hypothetical protein